MRKNTVLGALALGLVCNLAFAGLGRSIEAAFKRAIEPAAIEVAAQGTLEVAFSPDEGAEDLVIKVIDSSKSSIHLLAYSFTSAPVVAALIRAKKRGVAVQVVVDEDSNKSTAPGNKSRAALSGLSNAGIDVRLNGRYPIHHDKVIVADRATVQTGSFNYSAAAAHRNSENVIVNWNNPRLAAVYLRHFTRNYEGSALYEPGY